MGFFLVFYGVSEDCFLFIWFLFATRDFFYVLLYGFYKEKRPFFFRSEEHIRTCIVYVLNTRLRNVFRSLAEGDFPFSDVLDKI